MSEKVPYYQNVCIFDINIRCPMSPLKMRVDGAFCQACVDMMALRGLKTGMITQLLVIYRDFKKAKGVFEEIKRCAREW